MEASTVTSLYAQLFGVGLLWVTIHCSGMCGPIIAGLVLHTHPKNQHEGPWQHRWSVAKHVLAYQSGRGLMYVFLGGLAGLLGAQMEVAIRPLTSSASLVVAALLIVVGLLQIPAVKKLFQRRGASGQYRPPLSARFTAAITRRLPSSDRLKGPARMFVTGFMLGLLPCMLMFWVLGLSASSASMLHGALLMVCLVLLTTPILLAAGLSTTLISPRLRQWGHRIIPGGMIFSGVWLLLIAMAANGWIGHMHKAIHLFGREFMFMLW